MKVGEFTKLHRKSGGMGHPQSELYRSLFSPGENAPGCPIDSNIFVTSTTVSARPTPRLWFIAMTRASRTLN
jgi:hypothetical protein